MGKKKKKKKQYPRNTETVVKKEIAITKEKGLIAHINNGVVTLCDKNGVPYLQSDIDMTRTYKGENKTRIVTKATNLEQNSNCVDDWVKNFDVIYAVDTNTKPIHGGKHNFSIGIVYKGNINQIDETGGEIQCELYAGFLWIWSGNRKIEPENWVCAIEKIKKEESNHKKIALIVDSELGNYEEYNNRTKPLINDFVLPENFTLIYASADYADEWTNKMIRLCDKCASENLNCYIETIEKIKIEPFPDGMAIYQEIQTKGDT